jgi:poly(A) polymerase
MFERDFAIEVVRRLRDAGYEALWAGGCVRDELLGRTPKDYDVATNARPEEVQRLFRPTVAVGMSFGVIRVLGPKGTGGRPEIEVATFRSDVSYSDGRHPDAVTFSTAQEDALRRDFTVNGMFFDPLENRIIDYVGGRQDLESRVLRAIGEPAKRFEEDKLRMLRAVRIAACFNMTIAPDTTAAIKAMADQIEAISKERIADELRKLLACPQRSYGMNLLYDMGLVEAALPELAPMKTCPQGLPAAPAGNLWDHVMKVLDLLGPEPSFPLAFAALLHDVGKPRTVGRTPDRYTFYSHEHVGRRIASEICHRLKLSNVEHDRVEWLVEKHQFLCDARHMRTSKLKTTLAHPGIRELLALHRADALAWGHSTEHVRYCEKLLQEWTEADLNPPHVLTGHDLARMGLEPGPIFKKLLDAVREAQLEGTIHTTREALDLVGRLLKEEENGLSSSFPIT